jgi:hypothetical protein
MKRGSRAIFLAASVAMLSAAPASATDYCVRPASSCTTANTFDDIQPALTAAEAPGNDRVLIGPRTYVLPSTGLSYNGDEVEIAGVGPIPPELRQQTTSAGDGALAFNNGGAGRSTIRGLDFVVAQNTTGAAGPNYAVSTFGPVDVTGIGVRAAPDATRAMGVTLSGNATLSRSDILLGFLPDNAVGVLDTTSPTDSTAVRDSAIDADTGVLVEGGATTTVERSQLTVSTQGVWAFGGTALAYNDVVELDPHPASSNMAFRADGGSNDTSLDVRYATVTGGNASSYGLFVNSSITNSASAQLLDSIVRNPGTSLHRAGFAGAPAGVAANYNDFNPAAVEDNNAASPGTYNNLNARTDDPGFLGGAAPEGRRLRYDSPLIDAGHPAPLTVPADDYASNSHVVDGNGDGTVRADLGAYEYQRTPPAVTATAAPDPAFAGDPIGWSASGTDADGDPLTYSWSWDDGATGSGASVSHAFTAVGTHSGTVTVIDPTGLRAQASASAGVAARPGGGGPGGGGEVASADRTPPAFSLGRGALRLTRRNRVVVPVSCAAREPEACAGTLTLVTNRRLGRRVLTFGRARFSAAPGRTARVTVKVSKRKARLLRRKRRLSVRLSATARDRAGNQASARRTATLVIARTRR